MAKSDKSKVPKSVAGFKVPKALRKSGMLDSLVGTPQGRQLVADALIAAAAAAAAALVKARPEADGGKAGRTPKDNAVAEATKAAAGAVATFVTEAAHKLLPDSAAAETNGSADKPAPAKASASRAPRAPSRPKGKGAAAPRSGAAPA